MAMTAEQDRGKVIDAAQVIRPAGRGPVVLVCEHASNHLPHAFGDLGLSADDLLRHIAWDPGALAVAKGISAALDAPLVAGTVSRLLFDCNRPPEAADAVPVRSEIFDIPGNRDLAPDARADRVRLIHDPFRATLATVLDSTQSQALVTVHSFTPVYHGQPRAVDIGVLYDTDSRLADAMMGTAGKHTIANVQRNSPYGPQDGVTHTLQAHALPRGLLNVMLEIRNDLIATPEDQGAMSAMLARWIAQALETAGTATGASCTR